MIDRFDEEDEWKSVWFSDKSFFMLRAPMNRHTERIYREVSVKTDIEEKDLLGEIDRQQPSIMCYGAVSWHGKTELRFIQGWAPDQGHLPPSRRNKKTVNQEVYRNKMCPLMFSDINRVMGDQSLTWQQDGAKAHTAQSMAQTEYPGPHPSFGLAIQESRSECDGFLRVVTSPF